MITLPTRASRTRTAPQHNSSTTAELITPENLSTELLESALDAAMMETSIDGEGTLKVSDEVACFVFPATNASDRIQLIAQFGFHSHVSRSERLECANKMNQTYVIVRAVVGANDTLQFTYDIPISGGITRKAFVLAVKRFCAIPRAAVQDCADGLVA